MSLNFFRSDCQEAPVFEERFGICDDQHGRKAYTDLHSPASWVAEVVNSKQLDVVFTAIDKCVLQDHELPGHGRCDGMLTTGKHLYLVELKEKDSPWQSQAVAQLESTIQLLLSHHDISSFRLKKAFACNKKRPHFITIDNDENLAFFRRTGFRLDMQAEILIL